MAIVTVCVCVLAATEGTAAAQTLDPAFEQDILKFMDVIGVNKFGDQIGTLAARQMVDAVRKAKPDFTQRGADIMTEVVKSKFSREYEGPGGLRERLVPIYAKSFTRDEIRALTTFYATDLGKKSITAMPSVAAQTAQLAQQWANELRPEIQSEIERRLKAEGLTP